MKIKVICKICGKEEYVSLSRSKTYVTCSKSCLGKYKINTPNNVCKICNKPIYVKPSKKSTKLGNFCSIACLSEYQKIAFLGCNNPNYKGITRDSDGYVIEKIPKGYHIHHRDCNKNNNLPSNLTLLSISDHKWIHKQFGNAILWGYCKSKFNKKDLLECCTNINRADKILDLTIEHQIGIFNK